MNSEAQDRLLRALIARRVRVTLDPAVKARLIQHTTERLRTRSQSRFSWKLPWAVFGYPQYLVAAGVAVAFLLMMWKPDPPATVTGKRFTLPPVGQQVMVEAETTWEVAPGAVVEVVSRAQVTVKSPSHLVLLMGRLTVREERSRGKQGVTVETPTALVRPIGTSFTVEVNEEGKAGIVTTVVVIAGVVEVSNPFGKVFAYAGETAQAREEQAPFKGAAPAQVVPPPLQPNRLRDARMDTLPVEYLDQVKEYFKRLSERAKKK